MKLNKLQLIECLNYVQSRPDYMRAGQAFSNTLTKVSVKIDDEIATGDCDMFNVDSNIINFIANYCDQEAIQYFYSTHSQDLFSRY